MSLHETALDAIYEDPISDSDFEDGEIEENEQPTVEINQPMDVDVFYVSSLRGEEGEIVPLPSSSGDSAQGKGVTKPPRRKKFNKKRSGKRRNSVNVAQFVRETCTHLQEKKYPLVWAAVKNLGVNGVRNLIKEVDAIENCGGQMTNDGKRRRTPGGVLWNILRGRVQPDVYKEIMSQGNEVQKQKVKEVKESLKRNRMDVDEPVNNKRQKLALEEVDKSTPAAHGKKVCKSHQQQRHAKVLLHVTDGPLRDDSLLPAVLLQRAWTEGVRKKEIFGEASVMPGSSPGADFGLLKVETVPTVIPDKKSVPLSERLRLPVEYNDIVKEEASVSPSDKKCKLPLDYSEPVEVTHCKDQLGEVLVVEG